MPAHYVLTVKGEPGELLRAAFDDVAVSSGPGVTVLSAELDQAGLHGLLDRIADLGLELLDLRLKADPPNNANPTTESCHDQEDRDDNRTRGVSDRGVPRQ